MEAALKDPSLIVAKNKSDNWKPDEADLSYKIKKLIVNKYWADDNIKIGKLCIFVN